MEDQIDIRGEAVRDYLEQIPSWLIRWGMAVIFLVLLLVVFGSWLLHYPTIVRSSFRLTSENAPKSVVIKNDRRLVKLFVSENQAVSAGEVLGYLESTASHTEVLRLYGDLKTLQKTVVDNRFNDLSDFRAGQFTALGELQMAYQDFMQSYTQALSLFANGYYNKRKAYLHYELNDLEQNHAQLLDQHSMQNRDAELSQKEYEMNKKLFRDKVIAPIDIQHEESKYINKQIPVKQLEMSITNNMTAQTQKQRELTELDRQAVEQKTQFTQALNTLVSAVEDWQKNYTLQAPNNGKINLSMVLQENQMLKANTELMYVGGDAGKYFGEAMIPQINFGKIKVGQKVLVKFQSYPFEEYGMIEGKITSVSEQPTPDRQFFQAIIELPNGLKTNYNKTLIYKNGMEASAEIVTEDLRLIERVFYQLRKITTT
jgi:multidrug resistance efflux pump